MGLQHPMLFEPISASMADTAESSSQFDILRQGCRRLCPCPAAWQTPQRAVSPTSCASPAAGFVLGLRKNPASPYT